MIISQKLYFQQQYKLVLNFEPYYEFDVSYLKMQNAHSYPVKLSYSHGKYVVVRTNIYKSALIRCQKKVKWLAFGQQKLIHFSKTILLKSSD